ncbi:hypothetical protein OIO90_006432 [Microbotryomycetes sp. JL221]|nr:hypothetical protein OIO90_006432 [Microbotryomycetes sp. JL221]
MPPFGILQDAHRHNIPQDEARQAKSQRTPTKVAAIAAANRARSAAAAAASPSSRHASNNGVAAPLVVESQRYEEWMKIATDNKITSTNTWNLALIDYFHDMTLLRNGDDDSINFQKASCTLDGCVKIWTSRVDSVATETGKLLSGLADDASADKDDRGDKDADDEGQDDGDDDGEGRGTKTRKRSARQAATLADSFSKIKVKALDLEFTVDPLFKKTSADFDEGGAGGILMNHLGCDGSMRVVFDAGDAKLSVSDEDEAETVEQDVGMRVDLTALVAKFLPRGVGAVADMALCPSLSGFKFSPESNLDLDILRNADGLDDNDAPGADLLGLHFGDDSSSNHQYDDFANREFGGEGYMAEGFAEGDDNEIDFFAGMPSSEPSIESQTHEGHRGDSDIQITADGTGEHMFGYFDDKLSKNWAGPAHWKLRRAPPKPDEQQSTTTKPVKEKAAFSIDFASPPPFSAEELFAVATPASIRAPRKSSLQAKSKRSRMTEREDMFMLPDDCRFTSATLLRLFLKPKVSLRMRRRVLVNEEPDVEYWAGACAPDDDLGGEDVAMRPDYDDDAGDDYVVPFDTQILNDEHDVGFEDDEEEARQTKLSELDDLLENTQGPLRRVKPENINYAKRAKRVDVKKLKDTIWKELEDVTIVVDDLPASSNYSPGADAAAEPLVPVVSGLRKAYPKDKMDEISTSYCFICLLHLANEKGLRIQTPTDQDADEHGLDDGLQMRKSVGGIERLRVLRISD